MEHKELSVIVPVQESSSSFPIALLDIDNYLSKSSVKYEIIVSGLKDSAKLADFKKKIGSAIANIKFVSSDYGDITSISKAGTSASVGDAVLWVSSEHLFDSGVADEVISKIHAKGGGKCDVVFAVSKSNGVGEIIQEKLVNIFCPLSSVEVSFIAIDGPVAHKISGTLPARPGSVANFALDLSLVSAKLGSKIMELKRDIKSILPVDKNSAAYAVLSVIFVRAKFEAHWIREGLSISRFHSNS